MDAGIRTFILLAMGRREEALQLARRAMPPISRTDNTGPIRQAVRYYLEDRREEALIALHAATGVDPADDSRWPNFPDGEDSVGLAQMYARLGRHDLALLGICAGVERGYFCVSRLERDPVLDPLRADVRFQEAMSLARRRQQRAAEIFAEDGGPGLLGVR